jgi:hypothetical protein
VHSHEKRRAKLALADEDCQYDGTDHEDVGRLRKNDAGPLEVQWSACTGQQNATLQDAQKVRPARPQRVKGRSVPSGVR